VSGNPLGRPRISTLSKAYRDQLAEVCPHDSEGRTWAQVIAHTLAMQAAKGNVQAAAELADRVEGKPRQSLSLSREETEPSNVYGIIERLYSRTAEALPAGGESADTTPTDGAATDERSFAEGGGEFAAGGASHGAALGDDPDTHR
jgi:hypothetical protein